MTESNTHHGEELPDNHNLAPVTISLLLQVFQNWNVLYKFLLLPTGGCLCVTSFNMWRLLHRRPPHGTWQRQVQIQWNDSGSPCAVAFLCLYSCCDELLKAIIIWLLCHWGLLGLHIVWNLPFNLTAMGDPTRCRPAEALCSWRHSFWDLKYMQVFPPQQGVDSQRSVQNRKHSKCEVCATTAITHMEVIAAIHSAHCIVKVITNSHSFGKHN